MLAQRFTNFRDTVFEGFAAESALYAETKTCLVSLWIPFWDVCWGNEVCIPTASPFCFKLNRREAVSFLGSLPFKFKRSLTFGCSRIVCVCGNVSELCSVFCSSGHMCRWWSGVSTLRLPDTSGAFHFSLIATKRSFRWADINTSPQNEVWITRITKIPLFKE